VGSLDGTVTFKLARGAVHLDGTLTSKPGCHLTSLIIMILCEHIFSQTVHSGQSTSTCRTFVPHTSCLIKLVLCTMWQCLLVSFASVLFFRRTRETEKRWFHGKRNVYSMHQVTSQSIFLACRS